MIADPITITDLFATFDCVLDRMRLGKLQISLRLRSAITIFVTTVAYKLGILHETEI